MPLPASCTRVTETIHPLSGAALQDAFCTRDIMVSRDQGAGFREHDAKSFEHRLELVMVVSPVEEDMQVQPGAGTETLEEMFKQIALYPPDLLLGEAALEHEVSPPAAVQCYGCEGLIHRDNGMGKPADTPAVSQAVFDRIAKD